MLAAAYYCTLVLAGLATVNSFSQPHPRTLLSLHPRAASPVAVAADTAPSPAEPLEASPPPPPPPPPSPPPPPLLTPIVRDEYEVLRAGYDRAKLTAFFLRRPAEVLGRFADFAKAARRLQLVWDDKELRGVRLREELAKLGPVAVKLGQTLSQRPDIINEDLCEELKTLQTANTAFPNEQAFEVIVDELGWAGPVAPGLGPARRSGAPLFRSLSADPIACASLGQVYKGVTANGTEVAVKVQRPGAVRQVALDFAVCIIFWRSVQAFGWGSGDLLPIVDIVAEGVFEELDYRIEATNAARFKEAMEFLGYVDVPKTMHEYLKGPRVIVTEWVQGRHLDKLSQPEGLRMTYMAVEAVTASLVVTGFVHADPHEGNLMLQDDGTLVFLDFGLMSRVEPQIMEAFAQGIQSVLNRDYDGLVSAFIKTGFVGTPIQYRTSVSDKWGDGDPARMVVDLRQRMEAVPGGTSRFGALSTVLFEMGNYWYMYTPPYIILLIRTFLTLEGIAGQVDPNFNIYEVSLPWAIQRALSPCTSGGAEALRASLLTVDNKLQWERLQQLVEEQLGPEGADAGVVCDVAPIGGATAGAAASAEGGAEAAATKKAAAQGPVGRQKTAQQEAGSGAATPLDTVQSLLGSSDGSTLRRICRDLDSTELIERLVSPESKPLRRKARRALASVLTVAFAAPLAGARRALLGQWRPVQAFSEEGAWPISASSRRMRSRQLARFNTVKWVLIRAHYRQQLRKGWRGYIALLSFVGLCVNVLTTAVVKAAYRSGIAPPVALATAAAFGFGYRRPSIAMLALAGSVASVMGSRSATEEDGVLE